MSSRQTAKSKPWDNPSSWLLTLRRGERDSGIPYDTLRELVACGDLALVKRPGSKRIWIKRKDLESLIDSWTTEATP